MAATTALVALAAAGVYSQNEARQDQKKANKERKKQADAENIRERRKQIQAGRIARAEIANTGSQTGTADTSSAIGASGSISTQQGVNTSFLDNTMRRSGNIFDAERDASRDMFTAGIFNTASSLISPFAVAGAQKPPETTG